MIALALSRGRSVYYLEALDDAGETRLYTFPIGVPVRDRMLETLAEYLVSDDPQEVQFKFETVGRVRLLKPQ